MLSRLIAGLTLALMIPHAASAQTSRERASLNGFEHRDVALDDSVRIHYVIGGAARPSSCCTDIRKPGTRGAR
jgi:hypothetical protein